MAEEKISFSIIDKKKIVSGIEQGMYTISEVIDLYKIRQKKTLYSWISMYARDPSVGGKRPKYSPAIRTQAAIEITTGKISIEEAVRQYGLSKSTIEQWLSDFAAKNPLMDDKKQQQLPAGDTQKQIEELQLKIAALETMIDLAEQEYKLDIRKKCGTKQQ